MARDDSVRRLIAEQGQPVEVLLREYRSLRESLRSLFTQARRPGEQALLATRIDDLQETIGRLELVERRWLRATIPAQYRLSAGAANATLAEGGVLVTSSFGGLDTRAVRALQNRVANNLATTRRALTQGLALSEPRRRTVDAVREAVVSDVGLVADRAGVPKVRAPSGRLWDPEKYARMLTRTAIADARRVAFRQRYLSNGVDVVRVVANGTTHDVCRAWEGQRLSLTGATPGLPTVADARAAGLFHPNCTHRYVIDTTAEQPNVPAQPIRVPLPEPALPILDRLPAARVPAPRL